MITVNFERLSLAPGDRILDMGCGSGRHACAAARLEEVHVVGLDVNEDDVREARNRLFYEQDLGVQGNGAWAVMVADILCLPFESGAFDVVICSEVLEHIPRHGVAIDEILRVLRPGGHLVVSVPRRLPERICWALSDDYYQANGGHVRIYRKKTLAALLKKAGTRLRAFHYAHSLHTPYWWLKCLVGPTREDSPLVNVYHRFLVWDMMKKPLITRFLDYLLNPLLGKSLVLYLRKEQND